MGTASPIAGVALGGPSRLGEAALNRWAKRAEAEAEGETLEPRHATRMV